MAANKLGYNCTQLTPQDAFERHIYHRDQFSHYFRMYIADRLGVGYGTYTHFAVSLHMYERNFKSIDKIIHEPISLEILYDRKKFHANAELVSSLIDIANENHSREEVKKLMLRYAGLFFDFRTKSENYCNK